MTRGYELPRWCSGKEFACQCRRLKRHRFNPWVGEISWRRTWQALGKGMTTPPEKGMATFSRILAWGILWTEEPGGLQSMGSQRVRYDWESTHACDRNTVISGEWVKLKTWHFILEPAKSTKAVEQCNRTPHWRQRWLQWETKGSVTERRWPGQYQAVLVSELARTSQAGRGEWLGPHPAAAICSFPHRLCLLPLLRQLNFCYWYLKQWKRLSIREACGECSPPHLPSQASLPMKATWCLQLPHAPQDLKNQ